MWRVKAVFGEFQGWLVHTLPLRSTALVSALSQIDEAWFSRWLQCPCLLEHELSGRLRPSLSAKHSKHFDRQDALTIGVDRIQRNWTPMQETLEQRRNFQINDNEARLIIYRAFLEGRFPIKLMKDADHEFFEPSYEEFKPKTLWSMENAFTTSFKALKPVPQYEATARLGNFMKSVTPPF